ncbi:MAG: RNA methyltransferase [Bacteroidales bacterium]|nr:RNA methyltransferase [Candidatus Cryptobacteroides aphodequi]
MHCLEAGYEADSIFVREGDQIPDVPGLIREGGQVHDVPELIQKSEQVPDVPGLIREGEQIPDVPGLIREGGQVHAAPGARIFEVSADVYAKIAYRESTEGIIAEVRSRSMQLSDLKAKENPLYVVLESVEKPGNLGAVLRSADASGVDGVIVCDPLTDLFNPNLIRSSIGAIFTVPTVACSSDEAISFLKEKGVKILTAQLQDSELYYDTPMTGPTAIVFGTESTGLTDRWRLAADAHIRIPMLGALDSLNVSVSAAILMFEALRQRKA